MSERETRLLTIENMHKYNSIEEAEREANAIYVFTQRLLIKKDWSCKMVIVVSENDPEDSDFEIIKTGQKGRPIKCFVPKGKRKKFKKIDPHLHIIFYGNPAETIARPIVNNINKRHRRKNECTNVISKKFPVYGERGKYINYVLNQSSKTRWLNYDPFELLENFDFKTEYDYYYSRYQHGNYFYKNWHSER